MKIYGKKYWREAAAEVNACYAEGWFSSKELRLKYDKLIRAIREWKKQK